MSEPRPLPCLDCAVDTSSRLGIGEYYHVWERIWFAAFGRTYPGHAAPYAEMRDILQAGFLCVGCLEARLGRDLEPDDFSDTPVNDPALFSKPSRILNRMGKAAPA